MKSAAFAAHRAAASGLFTLFTLLAIVLGQGDSRLLALTIGGALGSLFLLTRPSVHQSLGVFAAPLAIVTDLALIFCAMSLTGARSPPTRCSSRREWRSRGTATESPRPASLRSRRFSAWPP